MPDTYISNDKGAACKFTIARYWGTCSETMLHAVELIKENPRMSVDDAITEGFAMSIESLLPPLPKARH